MNRSRAHAAIAFFLLMIRSGKDNGNQMRAISSFPNCTWERAAFLEAVLRYRH